MIAAQFELKDALELRLAVRRLKEVLKSEGIRIPIPEDYGPARGSKSFLSDGIIPPPQPSGFLA